LLHTSGPLVECTDDSVRDPGVDASRVESMPAGGAREFFTLLEIVHAD